MQNFAKNFENKIKQTIKKYELLNKKDKVIVACSGGKDSTTVLYLLKKFEYSVVALIIDLKIGEWSDKNLRNLQYFCKKYKIKLHVIDVRDIFGSSMCHIKSIAKSKNEEMNACMVCGVIKKWILNKKARELKATKLATGHNLDDEAQTIFLNMLKASPELSIGTGPKIGIIEDKRFVQRIKPLFFCREEDIRKYSELMNFNVQYERCPCHVEGFRKQIRKILNEFEEKNPGTKFADSKNLQYYRSNASVKEMIVKNFLILLPKLRKKYFTETKLKYCERCGEPCRQEICKACKIFELIKSG